MRTLARGLIYLAGMVFGGLALVEPVIAFRNTAEMMDRVDMAMWFALGALFIFAGVELGDALRRRWEREDRERLER